MSRMDKEFKKFLREVVIPKHKDACRAYPYNISRKYYVRFIRVESWK